MPQGGLSDRPVCYGHLGRGAAGFFEWLGEEALISVFSLGWICTYVQPGGRPPSQGCNRGKLAPPPGLSDSSAVLHATRLMRG
jgi:hypothetical protein